MGLSCLSLVLELLLLWFVSIYPEIYLLSKVIASRTRNGLYLVLQRYYEIFLSSPLILLMKTDYCSVPSFLIWNLICTSPHFVWPLACSLDLMNFGKKFQLANLQYSFHQLWSYFWRGVQLVLLDVYRQFSGSPPKLLLVLRRNLVRWHIFASILFLLPLSPCEL